MRTLTAFLATFLLVPAAHAGVVQDAAALRQKVQKSYSRAAVRAFDKAVKIGTPSGAAEVHDLSGQSFSRTMLQGKDGRSLTVDTNPGQAYEALYAGRSKDGTVLRQPGVQLWKNGLTVTDTVSRHTRTGTVTEGMVHQERSIFGKLARVESTTRYRTRVDGDGNVLDKTIRSDRRRLVIGGVAIPLSAQGKGTVDQMYRE